MQFACAFSKLPVHISEEVLGKEICKEDARNLIISTDYLLCLYFGVCTRYSAACTREESTSILK